MTGKDGFVSSASLYVLNRSNISTVRMNPMKLKLCLVVGQVHGASACGWVTGGPHWLGYFVIQYGPFAHTVWVCTQPCPYNSFGPLALHRR